MQIKPYDGTISSSPTSVRPTDVSQLTTKPRIVEGRSSAREPTRESDSVSLSQAGRGLAMTLSKLLPEIEGVQVSELLTPRDQFVLVRALELVRLESLDSEQIPKLVVDLYRFRAEQREALSATPSTNAELLRPEHTQTALLTLPRFNARDEAISQAILASLALRDTTIDRSFVRALLDPDRRPPHSVDFAFVRRLVVALSPGHSDGARDPRASLAPRMARSALAETLSLLALAKSELPEATAETSARGRSLLKERLSAFEARERVASSKPLLLELRASDRILLGMLYVAAEDRQINLKGVDDVAHALIALRRAEGDALSSRDPATRSAAPSMAPRNSHPATPPPRSDGANPAAAGPTGEAGVEARTAAQSSAEDALVRELLARGPERFDRRLSAPNTPSFGLGPERASAESALASQARTLASESGAPRDGTAAGMDEQTPLAARSFGSPSQLAARFAGTYRSLVPVALAGPAELEVDPRVGAAAAAPLAGAAAQPLNTGARPLDLGQLLGLSALVSATRAQGRRVLQSLVRRTPHAAIHAVTATREAASEAEADDPVHEDSRRRRRMRWLLLIQRRKHSRKHKS